MEGDVLDTPLVPLLAEPRPVPEGLALERRILERPPLREERVVALLGPEVGSPPDVGAFLKEDLLRNAALVALVATVRDVGIDPRSVAEVSEPRDRRPRGQPVLEEVSRHLELQVPGADPVELVRDVAGPGEELFVRLPPPMEAIGVQSRDGLLVHEAVSRKPRPLALARVLVGLELDLEEGNAVLAGRSHAVVDESVRVGVLGRGVVEDDDIAAIGIEDAILEQGKEQHPAGATAGELDNVRQVAVLLRAVAEVVLLVRIVLRGRAANALRDLEFRHVPDSKTRHQ